MSIRPASGLKNERGRLREGPSRPLGTPCLQDIPKKSDTRGSGERCEGQGGVLAPEWNRMKAEGPASWVGSSRLKERGGLHRRTGWGFGGQGQMGLRTGLGMGLTCQTLFYKARELTPIRPLFQIFRDPNWIRWPGMCSRAIVMGWLCGSLRDECTGKNPYGASSEV